MEFIAMMESLGVDAKATVYRFGNNEALLEKFVKKFSQETTYSLLEKSVKDKSYGDIETSAHTLKGVAANLGFQRLSDLCNELVWDVRNDTRDKIDPDFADVSEEYHKILDKIQNL